MQPLRLRVNLPHRDNGEPGGVAVAFSLTPGEALSAIPGVLALVGAALGIGRASQRLRTLELRVNELTDLKDTVTRIDERTKQAREDHKQLRDEVRLGNEKLDRLIERRVRT